MIHRVTLSNGRVLLVIESAALTGGELHIATEDFHGGVDAYIATISGSGVMVMPNSGDATHCITEGIRPGVDVLVERHQRDQAEEGLRDALADTKCGWTPEDDSQSIAQGWAICSTTDRGIQLQRIDCPEDGGRPKFKDDYAVAEFLKEQAANGDELAKRAIAYLFDMGSDDVKELGLDGVTKP
jgi:hypothetical protein